MTNPDVWVEQTLRSAWKAVYEAHDKNETAIVINCTLLLGGLLALWIWSRQSKRSINGTNSTDEGNGRNLKQSIKEFGENSYYYAHSKKYGDETTKWDGKPEPRLLRKDTPTKGSPTKRAASNSAFKGKPISKYAFADGSSKVKVYIDVPGLASLSTNDSDTSIAAFEWTALSFALRINSQKGSEVETDLVLDLPLLFGPITAGKWQQKRAKEQIVITLTKEEEGTDWKKLTS
jgi:hypothetical protein